MFKYFLFCITQRRQFLLKSVIFEVDGFEFKVGPLSVLFAQPESRRSDSGLNVNNNFDKKSGFGSGRLPNTHF